MRIELAYEIIGDSQPLFNSYVSGASYELLRVDAIHDKYHIITDCYLTDFRHRTQLRYQKYATHNGTDRNCSYYLTQQFLDLQSFHKPTCDLLLWCPDKRKSIFFQIRHVTKNNRFYLAVYNLNGITLNGALVVML